MEYSKYYKSTGDIDWNADGSKEHYETILMLLNDYWKLFDSKRISFDYEKVVLIEQATEHLQNVIEYGENTPGTIN